MPYSALASPSATIDTLKRYGLYTRKALGQHFLVDDNIVGRIVKMAEIAPGEPVIEVGPGIGTLTLALLDAGAHVTAVEFDDRLLPVLEDIRADHSGFSYVHADAVTVPVGSLAPSGEQPRALVANLPYGVAATVVLRFFEEIPTLERAIVMVQSEVADRMAARPHTKAYGAYTVKLNLRAAVASRFTVPPACFLPPPRVSSAVVRLDRVDLGVPPATLVAAAAMADAAFTQRRKTLRNSLVAGLRRSSSEVGAILEIAGVDGGVRAEDLEVNDYIRLATAAAEV